MMLINCLYLFVLSTILYFVAKFFEIWTNIHSYVGFKPESLWYRICEVLYYSVMTVSMVIFFVTLVLSIYIFIFFIEMWEAKEA